MENARIDIRVTKSRKRGIRARAKEREKSITEYFKFLDEMWKNKDLKPQSK